MSEFLLVTSTFARAPGLAVVLGLSLLVALGALLLRLNGLAFGEPHGSDAPCARPRSCRCSRTSRSCSSRASGFRPRSWRGSSTWRRMLS